MKLEENIKYLDMIRDNIDNSIRAGHLIKPKETFVGDNLSRACADGKRFSVTYVKVKPSDKTFIMRIYPDIDEIKDMAKPLMEKLNDGDNLGFTSMWGNIKNWHIEIDERVVTAGTRITVDNGSQFVAILCHEVGHAINAFPAKLVSNYKIHKAMSSMLDKALMSTPGKILLVLGLPLFYCISGFRIIISKPGAVLNEMAADAQVPNQYKSALIDYTNNHIMTNAETASGIVVTNEEYDNEQKTGIQFSRSTITLMKQRSDILKIHLATFGKLSPSPYLGKISGYMLHELGGYGNLENVIETKKAMESFERSYYEAEKKAAQMSAACEARIVSERDLLLLQVDIDGMETTDDKAYVLNTIFDYKESLEKNKAKALKKIKDSKKIPDTSKLFDDKIKKLDQMKEVVVKTKVVTYNQANDYASVYVKYPKGYEG